MAKIIPKFFGQAEKDKIIWDDPKAFQVYYSKLCGSRVSVVMKKFRKQRSIPQNSWYWAVVTVLAEYAGTDQAEMHDTLRSMFLGFDANSNFPILRSTTDLNTEEFTEYMAQIFELARQHEVKLPHPDEYELLLPPPDYIK